MAEAEDVPKENERVGFSDVGTFDSDLYTGNKSKFEGYHTSLAMPDDDEEDDPMAGQAPKRATYTGKLFTYQLVSSAFALLFTEISVKTSAKAEETS